MVPKVVVVGVVILKKKDASYIEKKIGNEFFVEVDDDYVQDDFNLTYLSKELPEYYEYQ